MKFGVDRCFSLPRFNMKNIIFILFGFHKVKKIKVKKREENRNQEFDIDS